MKPKDNGLANLHDRKREERGFCCMQLIIFLTDNGVKSAYRRGPGRMQIPQAVPGLWT